MLPFLCHPLHILMVRLLAIGQSFNARYNGRNECDEFPPASSWEGGEGAHRQCIFGLQNQLGGHMYNSYSALFKLLPGSPYIIPSYPVAVAFRSERRLAYELWKSKMKLKPRNEGSKDRRKETPRKFRAQATSTPGIPGLVLLTEAAS